jgi:hypothetical protein
MGMGEQWEWESNGNGRAMGMGEQWEWNRKGMGKLLQQLLDYSTLFVSLLDRTHLSPSCLTNQ